MYIKNIKISRFRAFRSAEISLQPGLNILIGPNNVGKSTILSAIDFVLNPNLQWWRREILTELDFFRGRTEDPIEVEVLVGCGRPRCVDGENKKTMFALFRWPRLVSVKCVPIPLRLYMR
jgi:energy-coupling factor transporter ATP-binding protein EcfA2